MGVIAAFRALLSTPEFRARTSTGRRKRSQHAASAGSRLNGVGAGITVMSVITYS